MGCGFSKSEGKAKCQLRVLVLGIQSSGKSTFAKQMKILHCNGFRDDEKNNYRDILTQNLLLGMKELLGSAEDLKPSNKKAAKFFSNANPYATDLNNEVIADLESLWNDKAIKTLIKNPGNRAFEFAEILQYLMKKGAQRLKDTAFTPTNEDILHLRQRTTGIAETKFKRDKYDWNIIDVGGQRVERRKWVHTQQGLNAVIFFASLVDYDVISEDDKSKTRMEESLEVWREVSKGDALVNLPVILFFNKKDIFPEKLRKSSLKKTFKAYKGGNDVAKAQAFIKNLYLKNIDKESPLDPNNVKTHFVCALDTENIGLVFGEIMNHILNQRLQMSGL